MKKRSWRALACAVLVPAAATAKEPIKDARVALHTGAERAQDRPGVEHPVPVLSSTDGRPWLISGLRAVGRRSGTRSTGRVACVRRRPGRLDVLLGAHRLPGARHVDGHVPLRPDGRSGIAAARDGQGALSAPQLFTRRTRTRSGGLCPSPLRKDTGRLSPPRSGWTSRPWPQPGPRFLRILPERPTPGIPPKGEIRSGPSAEQRGTTRDRRDRDDGCG